MEKIEGKEIKRLLKKTNNKGIYVLLKGVVSGRVTLHKIKCAYYKETGMIEIYDEISEDLITIETLMARRISTNESKHIIKIELDNDEEIIIKL